VFPVDGDAALGGSQRHPSGADERSYPVVEPVLDDVSGGVIGVGVLFREEVGDIVGAAQPERDDVIDCQRVPVGARGKAVFSLGGVLLGL